MEAHEGFEKIHLHRPPFGARSSTSVRIRIGSIAYCAMLSTKTKASLVSDLKNYGPAITKSHVTKQNCLSSTKKVAYSP